MATGDLHTKFLESRLSGSRNTLADRHTDRQTDTQIDRNALLPYNGADNNNNMYN